MSSDVSVNVTDLVTVGALGVLWPGLTSAGCAPVLGLRGEGEILIRGAVVRNLDGLHLLLDLWLVRIFHYLKPHFVTFRHLLPVFLRTLGLPALLLGEDVVNVDGVPLVNQHGDDAPDVPAPGLPHPVVRPRVLNNRQLYAQNFYRREIGIGVSFKKL